MIEQRLDLINEWESALAWHDPWSFKQPALVLVADSQTHTGENYLQS
jgi:hypothetical protein